MMVFNIIGIICLLLAAQMYLGGWEGWQGLDAHNLRIGQMLVLALVSFGLARLGRVTKED